LTSSLGYVLLDLIVEVGSCVHNGGSDSFILPKEATRSLSHGTGAVFWKPIYLRGRVPTVLQNKNARTLEYRGVIKPSTSDKLAHPQELSYRRKSFYELRTSRFNAQEIASARELTPNFS
jgi:hypothetical protein